MPPVRLDMSASQFNVLPAGEYNATIASWKLDKPSAGAATAGAPRIEVTYALEQGGKIWDRLIFHPKTFWTFKRMAVAAGYSGEALSGERDIFITRDEADEYPDSDDPLIVEDVMDEIRGANVILTLKIKPAEGEHAEKNEIAKVSPDDTGSLADAWPKKAA